MSMGAFFDRGLSELFEGVPVPVPVRYRGEREPELEEAGGDRQNQPPPAESRAGFRPEAAITSKNQISTLAPTSYIQ